MTEEAYLAGLLGGRDLVLWFGRVPRFHDANLLDLQLNSDGPSRLRIHAWRITNAVAADSSFVLDRHVVVTIALVGLVQLEIRDFHLPTIIHDLAITRAVGCAPHSEGEEVTQLAWESSYGASGFLRARSVSFGLQPGMP